MTVLLLFADRILCARQDVAKDAPAHDSAGLLLSEVPIGHASPATPDAVTEALRFLRSRKDSAHIRSGESVLILAESVFSQVFHLPARQLAGLSSAELEQALAYEAEPFSGFASGTALTAFRRGETANGETAFTVTQFSKSGVTGFARAIAAARCICAGIGGIPADDANDPANLAAAAAAGRIPLLLPQSAASALWRTPALVGGVLLCIALLSAIGYGLSLSSATRTIDARLLEARELARENRTLESELDSLKNRSPDAPGSNAGTPQNLRTFRHAAWKRLLDLFDTIFSERGKIIGIEELGSYDVRVTALFANAAAYETGTAELMEKTTGTGWTIIPEQAENLRFAGEHAPWRFVFRAQGPDSVRNSAAASMPFSMGEELD